MMLTTLLLALAPAHADDVGVYDLVGADSATLLAGGGASFGWLNVDNVAVDLNTAMTASLGEMGFANADSGTTIEYVFDQGVVNLPGPDLVALDLRFDDGQYALSTDYDGFVRVFNPVFNPTGASGDYYYLGYGPYAADVFGGEVDLSALGVPDGAMVNTVRLVTQDTAGDPGGLGSLNIGVDLVGTCPGPMEITVSNATPGGTVAIVSADGPGTTAIPAGGCAGTLLTIAGSVKVRATRTADALGHVVVTPNLPAGVCGYSVQVVDFDTCTVSNAETL